MGRPAIRSSPPDRRDTLLAAARAVFAEKGFDAATVSEIVGRAGVAQGTFYLYFPSKASLVPALFATMMDSVLAVMQRAVAEASGFEEALTVSVRVAFQETRRYQDVLAILFSRAGLSASPSELAQLDEPYYALIVTMLERGKVAGQVAREVDAELVARMIVGMVARAMEDCFLYRPEVSAERYITEITRFLQRALEPR